MQMEKHDDSYTHHLFSLSSSSLRRPLFRIHREPTLDRMALSISSDRIGLSCALLADCTACLKSYMYREASITLYMCNDVCIDIIFPIIVRRINNIVLPYRVK